MEKRINKKIEQYIVQFKDDIRNKINSLNQQKLEVGSKYPIASPDVTNYIDNMDQTQECRKFSELIEYIYEYEKLTLTNDDFIKRKRLKNSIPNMNRCTAKLANGEQCTRRRKKDCEYCGTHYKGLPHGLMDPNENPNSSNKKTIDIFTEDILGIIYYMDKYNNIYNVTDVLECKENPQIIGKYSKNGSEYKITYL